MMLASQTLHIYAIFSITAQQYLIYGLCCQQSTVFGFSFITVMAYVCFISTASTLQLIYGLLQSMDSCSTQFIYGLWLHYSTMFNLFCMYYRMDYRNMLHSLCRGFSASILTYIMYSLIMLWTLLLRLTLQVVCFLSSISQLFLMSVIPAKISSLFPIVS